MSDSRLNSQPSAISIVWRVLWEIGYAADKVREAIGTSKEYTKPVGS